MNTQGQIPRPTAEPVASPASGEASRERPLCMRLVPAARCPISHVIWEAEMQLLLLRGLPGIQYQSAGEVGTPGLTV